MIVYRHIFLPIIIHPFTLHNFIIILLFTITKQQCRPTCTHKVAPWCTRLVTRLPLLGSQPSHSMWVSWWRRVIGISGSLIWSKTLMELVFNSCVNFGEVRRAQLAKSTLLTSTLVPLGSFQIF